MRGDQYLESKGVSPKRHTFDNFKNVFGAEVALKAFREIASGNPDKPFLLCYGVTGNGKSHLCEAAASELIANGRDIIITLVTDLCSDLRMSIESNTVEKRMQRLKSVDFLFLDDYGLEYGSNWEQGKIEEILAHRYREVLVTVMTTNKDIKDIPVRIQSRFSDDVLAQMVLNSSPDHRKLSAKK